MFNNFLNSAYIIDDKPEDVTNLKNVLTHNHIAYKFYTPDSLSKSNRKWKNKKLIFLDLYMIEGEDLSGQISYHISNIFRKKIGSNYGIYGIVLWSQHTGEVEEGQEKTDLEIYKDKIGRASQHFGFTPPLFIIGLDKNKYYRKSTFKPIFLDLTLELEKNSAANFFIKWSSAIEKGKTNVIANIFSLIKDYEFQDDNIKYLLYHLAINQTGIQHGDLEDYPLYSDAYKAFSDLLLYDIVSQMVLTECKLFESLNDIRLHYRSDAGDKVSIDYDHQYYKNDRPSLPRAERGFIDDKRAELFANLNTRTLLDETVKHNKILPGNVYKIKDPDSIFITDKKDEGDIPIIIEMTPPCDFANGKKAHPKVLGGFIANYDKTRIHGSLKGEAFYTEPHPLKLIGYEENKMISFDFRYMGIILENDLLDNEKYELIFRAKDNLFADILQKMSSHIARLGLAVLN